MLPADLLLVDRRGSSFDRQTGTLGIPPTGSPRARRQGLRPPSGTEAVCGPEPAPGTGAKMSRSPGAHGRRRACMLGHRFRFDYSCGILRTAGARRSLFHVKRPMSMFKCCFHQRPAHQSNAGVRQSNADARRALLAGADVATKSERPTPRSEHRPAEATPRMARDAQPSGWSSFSPRLSKAPYAVVGRR